MNVKANLFDNVESHFIVCMQLPESNIDSKPLATVIFLFLQNTAGKPIICQANGCYFDFRSKQIPLCWSFTAICTKLHNLHNYLASQKGLFTFSVFVVRWSWQQRRRRSWTIQVILESYSTVIHIKLLLNILFMARNGYDSSLI